MPEQPKLVLTPEQEEAMALLNARIMQREEYQKPANCKPIGYHITTVKQRIRKRMFFFK